MSRNFEKLIEYIINSDETNARKLFHQIVVSKSRTIYESMEMEGMHPAEDEEMEEAVDGYIDEVEADEAQAGMMEDDMEPEQTDDMADMGAGDDMGGMDDDMADHEDHGGEEDMEDRVVDLEDAIEELKAEFEKLMADEGEEDEEGAEDEEAEDEGEEAEDEGEEDETEELEEGAEEDEDEDEEDEEMEEGLIREYTEKVGDTYKGGKVAGTSEEGSTNKKSTVAGKNDMGGTAKNLVQGGEEKGRTAPDAKPVSSHKFQNAKGGGTGKLSAGPKPTTKEESGINKDSVFESKKTAKATKTTKKK
jgi:hypothetical protein